MYIRFSVYLFIFLSYLFPLYLRSCRRISNFNFSICLSFLSFSSSSIPSLTYSPPFILPHFWLTSASMFPPLDHISLSPLFSPSTFLSFAPSTLYIAPFSLTLFFSLSFLLHLTHIPLFPTSFPLFFSPPCLSCPQRA